VEVASRRACDLICRLAGGEVAEGLIDVWQRPWQPQEVTLRPRRTCDLLGFEVSPERQVEILEGLGTNPRMREGAIVCTPPSYRSDLTREADLIEEVARMEGYDRIPVREAIRHAVVPETPRQRTTVRVQRALAAAGFDEAITPAYLEPSENELFGLDRSICVDPNHRRTHGALRGTLLPSLMAVCKTNQDAGVEELSVYELASIFPPGGPDGRPDERIELAMATTLGLRRLRGAIEAMVEDLAPRARLEVRPGQQAGFDSAAAELFVDDEPLGRMGRIDGKVQDRYGLEKPVCGAALRFERLLELGTAERGYEPIPRLPAVQRDLSLIVDEPVRWADLLAAVDQRPQALREAVDYVTTYRGKPVPAGRKSVTIRLRYRAADQTLRGEQVDELVGDLVEHLCDRLNAELRT
jgi:phenylalanyl-tRNA synthetase beta chain